MKNIWKSCLLLFAIVIGITSCENPENFEQCPEINVTIDNVPGSVVYRFVAQIDGIEDVRLTWSIDGEEIDSGNLDDIAGQILDYKFEPGKHNVCVKVASEDCPIEVCKEIDVIRDDNKLCPDLFFETRKKDSISSYKFIADFRGVDSLRYDWYINDELVEDSNAVVENYLIWQFDEPGRYEVCIKAETPDCPNGASYCKVIEVKEVDGACPEPSFSRDGEFLYADFEGRDQIKWYGWYVNGEHVEDEHLNRNRDNKFFLENLGPGTYEICILYETPNCPDANENRFCKEIVIIRDEGCPELSFEAEQDGDNLAYFFYPSAFEGIDNVKLEWYSNGKYIGASPDNPHNNPFYYQFNPGRYEICLRVETPECPNGVEFCKMIEVEKPGQCLDLKFSRDGDYLYADFPGIDTLQWYGWGIDGEFVEDEHLNNGRDNKFSLKNLEKGTYNICIFTETPECPSGTRFCQKITIE